METNGSRIGIVVTLNQHGQELSGYAATSDDTNPSPIEKAEIRGDTITSEVYDNANRIVKFRLALTDGLLTGETIVGDRVCEVVLSPGSDAGFYPIAGGLLSSPPLLLKQVEPGYTEEERMSCRSVLQNENHVDASIREYQKSLRLTSRFQPRPFGSGNRSR